MRKTRLLRTELSLGAAEMVEHDRYWRRGDQFLNRGDHHQIRVQLDMPATRFHAIGGGLKTLARDIGIVDSVSYEVEPEAAKTCLIQGVEVAIGCLVVDHSDTACA